MQTRTSNNKSPVLTRTASVEQIKDAKVNFNPDNCCWICEGWLEKRFRLNLTPVFPDVIISDDISTDYYNVFMHFDFDDFEPDIMQDRRRKNLQQKGKFVNHRMIP
jgi:hypothetical protein